jgi:uncharacterized protein (TIGR02284 family)
MDQDKTVDILNKLIETSKDGEYGFRSCAEHAKTDSLKQMLNRYADECRQAANELKSAVVECGGSPEDGGTVTGAVHRGWVSVKGTLAGHSDVAMLEEAERGEDAALERYRDCLKEELPANVRALVQRQYEGVKRNHDEVRSMRNQARAT